LTEFLNLVVGAGVLTAKLVAWETKDNEVIGALGFDRLVKGLEAFKLRRETAFRRGVDDKDNLAL
jgi:hypothetical protein